MLNLIQRSKKLQEKQLSLAIRIMLIKGLFQYVARARSVD